MKTNEDFNMFSLFEMTPDFVCIAGKDGYFKKVNHAVIEKLGYSQAELFANPISSFIFPEDHEATSLERDKLLTGEPLVNFQNRYICKSGEIVWLHWTSVYFPEKEVVFAIAKDVTIRKQSELEIEEKYKKFKNLATHFKKSIEKDKQYLAIELHEELAQLASVVKMDITWLKVNETSISKVSVNRLEHAIATSSLLIDAIRRISFSVSPGMLDDLGLNETILWLCDEFESMSGIPCNFEFNYDEESLTREIQMDIFRICQEALRNVLFHANANKVTVTIRNTGEKICLSIEDDGDGFEFDNHKNSNGLTSIRERAASINAGLTITSSSGKGTRISVSIATHEPAVDLPAIQKYN